MKTLYQLVQIKKYGKKTIIFEANKYADVVAYVEQQKDKLINLKLQIQQANIIKNTI